MQFLRWHLALQNTRQTIYRDDKIRMPHYQIYIRLSRYFTIAYELSNVKKRKKEDNFEAFAAIFQGKLIDKRKSKYLYKLKHFF